MVSEEVRAKILKLASKGMSTRKIAERTSVGKSTAANIIREARQNESLTSASDKRKSQEPREGQMKLDLGLENLLSSGNRENVQKGERNPGEEEFEKQVFRMFNRALTPNRVIAKLGRTDRVLELWRKFRAIMEDDYAEALAKTAEYDLKLNGKSRHPLTEHLDRLVRQNHSLKEEMDEYLQSQFAYENKLGEFEGTVKSLRRKNARKARKIEALTTENEKLSRLVEHERLIHKKIEAKKALLERLDEAILSRNQELIFLEMQANEARHTVFGLHSQITETVKEILARMPDKEVWTLIVDAKWGRTDPLMAQMSKWALLSR